MNQSLRFKRYKLGESFNPATAERGTLHLVPEIEGSTEMRVKVYDIDNLGNTAVFTGVLSPQQIAELTQPALDAELAANAARQIAETAISDAAQAQSTADGKNTIFLIQPSNYKLGDMWILAADQTVDGTAYEAGEILTATQDGTTYDQVHWVKKVRYTDDTRANQVASSLTNFTDTVFLQEKDQLQLQIDGKRRVFTTTPTVPYDVGDLWAQGTNGDLMRCATAKTSAQSYDVADWEKASKYTDDTVAEGKNATFFAKPANYKRGDTWFLTKDETVNGIFYRKGTMLHAAYATGQESDWRQVIYEPDATSGVNILRNYDLRFPDFAFWGDHGSTVDVDETLLPTSFYKTGFNILADEYGFNYPILDENGNEIVM